MNTDKTTTTATAAPEAPKLSTDTLRSIAEIRRNGYYPRSQGLGTGGWQAIAAEIKNWRSYWLSAADSNGDHFDDNITAINDKVAKAYFAATYDLDALAFYSIMERTTSNREIATSA